MVEREQAVGRRRAALGREREIVSRISRAPAARGDLTGSPCEPVSGVLAGLAVGSLVFLVYPIVAVARGAAGPPGRVVPAAIVTIAIVAMYLWLAFGGGVHAGRRGLFGAMLVMAAAGFAVPAAFGSAWLGLPLFVALSAALAQPLPVAMAAIGGVSAGVAVVGVLIGALTAVVLSVSLVTAFAGAGMSTLAWALKTNRALRSARSEIARLAAGEERVRLSRELHDAVKQQAFVAAMELGATGALLPGDPDGARRHLERADTAVRQVQAELAGLITQLRPETTTTVQLADRLREYLAAWSERHGIVVDFREAGTGPSGSPEIQHALFAAASEALTNVGRHSHATSVTVVLDHQAEAIVLTIADDGRGFAPSRQTAGSGLAIMRERLAGLGGTCALTSAPGSGTRIALRCPVSPCPEQAR